jgi:hypothetical protein
MLGESVVMPFSALGHRAGEDETTADAYIKEEMGGNGRHAVVRFIYCLRL